MSTTLLLDTVAWDLCLDASNNIALAAEPYAIAQDVASAQRTFQGEVWYDTRQGVPYLQDMLGRAAGPELLKSALETAALTVPNVASAVCSLSLNESREVTGQTEVTTVDGTVVTVGSSDEGYIMVTTESGQSISVNRMILSS